MKKKPNRSQIEKFQRDTQGMTNIQKLEYLRMSESEREQYLRMSESEREQYLKSQNRTISEEKGDDKKEKDMPVKIIRQGQISVNVLNMRGKPLMPTSPKKARFLLKKRKAKVVQRNPFTIQLKYATGENRQPIKLGLADRRSRLAGTCRVKDAVFNEDKLWKYGSKSIDQRN